MCSLGVPCVDVYNIAQMAALCWFGGQLVYCLSCDTYCNKLDAGAHGCGAAGVYHPSQAAQACVARYMLRLRAVYLHRALRRRCSCCSLVMCAM